MFPRVRFISSFWAAQLIAWPAYGIVSFVGVLPYVGLAPHLDSIRSAFFSKVAFTAAGFFASGLLRLFYSRESERSSSWVRIALAVIALSYGAGMLATLCGNTARELVSGKVLGGGWSGFFGGAINASAVFLAWSACYFAVRNYQSAENQKKAALRANALAHQAQLEMLRSQVNPHFLFNALNSVHALVKGDPARAQTAIEELSDFLRYSLARARISDVPLSEEIEVLERYLAIEKIRYEEKLSVRVDIGLPAMQIRVPGLLLHPLLENAIKYGMQTSAMPLQIRLEAERVGDSLRVMIANTGRWVVRGDAREMELGGAGTGLGLRLVRERLEQAFPGRHQFACVEQNGWVENSIEINLTRATAGAA
jgi:two-component system LytT family sensor kinase